MWLVIVEHGLLVLKYCISILFGSDEEDKFVEQDRANAEIMKQYEERKEVIENDKQLKNHDLQRARYKKALREK